MINWIKEQKMPLEELIIKKRQERKENFEKNKHLDFKKQKSMHNVFNILLKISRKFSPYKLENITKEDFKLSNKPHIFLIPHVGRYDIECGLESIKEHAIIFWGDAEETYKGFDSLAADMNGRICLDLYDTREKELIESIEEDTKILNLLTDLPNVAKKNQEIEKYKNKISNNENLLKSIIESIKEDKKIAVSETIRALKNGNNLFLYPEGAWNIFHYQAMMKLFKGAVHFAKEANADIIPLGMAKYKDRYVVNIGKPIEIDKDADEIEETNKIRNIMATLNWEIYENEGLGSREELGNYEERLVEYIDDIMKDSIESYDIDFINKTRFRDKDQFDFGYGPDAYLERYYKVKKKIKK